MFKHNRNGHKGQGILSEKSQNDIDDAFDIFTSNPQVAETYAAILDKGMCSRYLQKRLSEFQAERYNRTRKD
jgi:hypothetical protein